MSAANTTARSLLRHTLATLAYRAAKVLRDPPAGFAECRPIAGGRTPLELVGHLGDLMAWAVTLAEGPVQWQAGGVGDFARDVERFFAGLARLDAMLASERELAKSPETIFQGPIADALTHTGQLAMLRRAAGSAVRPESYAKATIVVGRVGPEQTASPHEFDGDASARRG